MFPKFLLAKVKHPAYISPATQDWPSKFQVSNLFTANPPITTLPFSPKTLNEPSKSLGLVAVVASIIPKAPFLNLRVTFSGYKRYTPKALYV